MSKKECPACHQILFGDADTCPKCGMMNLNQIFLSKKDYEMWVDNILKPYLERMAARVFAGFSHALILNGKGELYGIGKNDCGQIDRWGPENISAPHLIAKKVKSAAAGRDYSIYVTNEGEVKMLGIGEYAEKFEEFSHAEEVFSMPDKNIFWIKDEKGKIYAFGDNDQQDVEPHTEEELYQFAESCVDIIYENHVEIISMGTQGKSTFEWMSSNGFEMEKELITKLMEDDSYKRFKKKYGEHNIYIKVGGKLRRQLVSGRSFYSGNRTERYFCAPKVMRKNRRVYQPVLCHYEYIKQPFYKGCGLIPLDNQWVEPRMYAENIKKANFRYGLWLVLLENGELWLYRKRYEWEKEVIYKSRIMEQVSDISLGQVVVMITKEAGEVLYGDTDIVGLLSKDDEDFRKLEQQMTRFRI